MKRTPLRRKSKAPKAVLVRQADSLWAWAVKVRAKGMCEQCGKPGSDAHHMKSRKSHLLRWDLRNGVFLCKGCHMRFHNQESWTLWQRFEEIRGDDWRFVVENLHGVAPKDTLEKAMVRLKAFKEANEE